MEVARHVQSTQNRKLAIFSQYIKTKVWQLLLCSVFMQNIQKFYMIQSCSLLLVFLENDLEVLGIKVFFSAQPWYVCVGGGGKVFKPIVTNTSNFHQFEINVSTCVTKVGCPFWTCRTLFVNFEIGPEEYYCNCNLKNGQSCFNFFSESYRTKKNMLFNEAEKFNSMLRKSSNLSKDEKPHAYPLWSKGEMIEVNVL